MIRLKHLFYATAVLASCLALFGSGGLFVGAMICAAWAYVFFAADSASTYASRARRVKQTLIALSVAFLLGSCVFTPQLTTARNAARRMQCQGHLKQLGLAMHNYEAVYNSFPPAITYDSSGNPMHSWRVLLLPFMEHQTLYKRYDFSEPWDGPNNSKLAAEMPNIYRCPASKLPQNSTSASYCVVVDPNSAFPPDRARGFRDFPDGLSNSVLVVEYEGRARSWLEPHDVSADEYLRHVSTWGPSNPPSHSYSDTFTHYYHGESIAMADGAVNFLSHPVDVSRIRAMVMVNDGESATTDSLELRRSVAKRVRIEGYVSSVAFLVALLLPAFWLRK